MVDVTDATFETEVMARSETTPVVVDLWAEWCGPCRTLGPIIEKVVAATNGRVMLAKVDVDANPQLAQMFKAQSIPAVHAISNRKVVDSFMGAQPESVVAEFVARLAPSPEQLAVAAALEAGDETSLRGALEVDPGNVDVVCALAQIHLDRGESDAALELLGRVPDTPHVRHIAALARTGGASAVDVIAELDTLLDQVKGDDDARQRFVDLLEVLGPDDERTGDYRRQLTSRLY